MEDDDEFGDLYTDVLTPFATSSSLSQPPPPQSESTSLNLNRPIDLNAQSSDDDEILTDFTSSGNQQLILAFDDEKPDEQVTAKAPISAATSGSRLNLNLEVDKTENLAEARGFEDPNSVDESAIDIILDERDDKGDVLVDKNEALLDTTENLDKFDIEEANTGIGDEDIGGGADIEGDDWDSDSEDDLQIVLNNDHDVMAMDRMGAEDDDEDEDGEPLVILDDGDPNHHPALDDHDWGEDAGQVGDGERKDLGDGAKVNGGLSQPSKLPFNNHMYHPFHSQFKYVRPGAAPMPGTAPVGPGGAPGQQVRPGVNMGAIGGRGRGEWRPSLTGMQKNFNSGGFGVPGGGSWGNNGPGRAFGSGPEFTLPSHKTIFEVDIDSFEEKPWKLQGIEISDFFNFGMNEETWKDYCKQLEQLRLEATMQSRIRVYESGRTEQEYDPDMPPELAAAAGIHDVSSENPNISKSDAAGQIDLTKDSRSRPQLPTGRAIQVETGYGERLPSIDTRAPRIRDSDAIIEIVLQDSADDETTPVNETSAGPNENEPPRLNNLSGGPEIEEDAAEEDTEENFDNMPQQLPYDNDNNDIRKREFSGRRPQFKNSIHGNIIPDHADQHHNSPFLPEIPPQFRPDPRAQNSVYAVSNSSFPHDERRPKGRMRDRSPNLGPTTQDKRFPDNQREDSVESFDTKHRPPRLSSSPVTVKNTTATPDKDEIGVAEAKSPFDTDSLKDENRRRSSKKQRVGSDDARSSENSREDEVIEERRSARPPVKRSSSSAVDDDHHKIKGRDERRQLAPPPHHRNNNNNKSSSRDNTNATRHSHVKSDSNNNPDVLVWQRKDETGGSSSRQHRSKEPTGSRHVDNGNWTGSRHVDREDSVKVRESTSRRKRERDDNIVLDHQLHNNNNYNNKKESLDQRRRSDRSDDQRSVRHKEETGWFQRVREREENIPYKRESVRSGRSNNDNNDYHVKEERRSRQERESNRTDRAAVNASDNNQKVHHEKKHKESSSMRKSNKESEGDASRRNLQEDSSAAASRRNLQEDHGSERVKSRGTIHESRKHKEDASSDEEQQDSRRGRSKLERWTSHKERDFTLTAKSSSSTTSSSALNIKDIDGYKSTKTPQESSKTVIQPCAGSDAKSDGNADEDNNNNNKHLDTVAKLKKRSERFKLPMPSEKEALAVIKKMENEPLLPSLQTETRVDFSEVKHERPPRKRRWTSN